MHGMAISLKKVSLYLRARAKIGILQLVTNLELKAQAPEETIRSLLPQQESTETRQYTDLSTSTETYEPYTAESYSQTLSKM